jgi:transcriptional regulator with XRE-family HTH domain
VRVEEREEPGQDRAKPGKMANAMPTRFNHQLLARARTENGLSQDEVAQIVRVDPRTYRRYESGEVNEGGAFNIRNASRRRLVAALCAELGIAEEELVHEVPVGGHAVPMHTAGQRTESNSGLAPNPVEGPRVFVSYSADSEDHCAAVEAFARLLESWGMRVSIDMAVPYPAQGWAQWSISEVAEADFVLMVCTPLYRGRVEQLELPARGRGATWESALLGDVVRGANAFTRLGVVLLGAATRDAIPGALRMVPRLCIPQDVERLRAWLAQARPARRLVDEVNELESDSSDDELAVFANEEDRALAEYLRDLEALKNFDPGDRDSRLRPRLEEQINEIRQRLRSGAHLSPGQTLDGGTYELVRLLGTGGFGFVWMARDRKVKRTVAIKVLKPEHRDDRMRRARFLRGARVMASFDHPNIVDVIDAGRADAGQLYFVMEHVAGGDLQAWLRRAPKPSLPRILNVIRRVGDALMAAHRRGIVHRDVKPGNILVDPDGNPKLTDFDLVHVPETSGGTQPEPMGTYLYSSPEVLSDPSAVDPRADVYSLGMTLLDCLVGGTLSIASKHEVCRLLEATDVPEPLKAIVARATAMNAAGRYETMNAFVAELASLVLTLHPAPERAPDAPTMCPLLRAMSPSTRRFPLVGARTIVGRDPGNDLHLDARYVSAQHALLCWTGQTWMVRDLSSRNGIFVDHMRIGSGESARLREGSIVAFGNKLEAWEVVGADQPPDIAAVNRSTGELALPTGGILVLPTPAGPATIFLGSEGWVCQRGERVRKIVDGEEVETGGSRWVVRINAYKDAITTDVNSELFIRDIEIVFRLSDDDEYVQLILKTHDRTIDCGNRAHNYLLLLLARRRLADQHTGLADSVAGWVQMDDLKEVASHAQLNIDVFRIRKQFAAVGVEDAGLIVERRPRDNTLRIGTSRVSIVMV